MSIVIDRDILKKICIFNDTYGRAMPVSPSCTRHHCLCAAVVLSKPLYSLRFSVAAVFHKRFEIFYNTSRGRLIKIYESEGSAFGFLKF